MQICRVQILKGLRWQDTGADLREDATLAWNACFGRADIRGLAAFISFHFGRVEIRELMSIIMNWWTFVRNMSPEQHSDIGVA